MEIENVIDDYKTTYQSKINDEVEKYFDYLTEKSEINLDESKEISDKFKKESQEFNVASKKQRISNGWKKTAIIQLVYSLLISGFLVYALMVARNGGGAFLDSEIFPIFIAITLTLGIVSLIIASGAWGQKLGEKMREKQGKPRLSKKEISMITCLNLTVNSILAFVTFFSVGFSLFYGVIGGLKTAKILIIVFLTLWLIFMVADIAMWIYFSKVSKTIQAQVDEIGARLFATNELLKNNLKPLKNLSTLDGIEKEIADKIFPFINLNVKTSQSAMEVASLWEVAASLIPNKRNKSVRYVKSGVLNGFPFLYLSTKNMKYENVTYRGTMQVTYLKTRKVTRNGSSTVESYKYTETLVAYHTAPAPKYYVEDALYYYNDAAPSLSFTRTPNHADEFNKSQLNKFIKKQSKLFENEYKKAINKNTSFQPILGNLKFESLFNCLDRDNEAAYRLLFTPLAQKQYEKLLLTREFSDGDNFILNKQGNFHKLIKPQLSHVEAKVPFDQYIESFDNWGLGYNELKEGFIQAYRQGMESLYKALVPFMAIPLYLDRQNNHELVNNYTENIAVEQLEADINSIKSDFYRDALRHEDSTGEQIYCVSNKTQNGNQVNYSITAYGHQEIPRVEYVTVKAGNGQKYQVPVEWIEYIEVEKTTDESELIKEDTEINNFLNKGE
ncbi:MAG1210 family protein [Mycoplasma sp. Z331B]|uniref:tripartite tricarboxylate transporter TctB family protein n=1 Tax=Mycoplasma sp. Z331B TaxID=3398775 RepID=UPI003A87D87B